jgi:hypothetical protein
MLARHLHSAMDKAKKPFEEIVQNKIGKVLQKHEKNAYSIKENKTLSYSACISRNVNQ